MYCSRCGTEVPNGAGFCPNCGSTISAGAVNGNVIPQPDYQYSYSAGAANGNVSPQPDYQYSYSAGAANGNVPPQPDYQYSSVKPARRDDTMETLVKVFLILGCISIGWALIPLAWCIPITLKIFNAFRDRTPIGIGLKICALILVSPIAGIILLIMDEI